ncbi:MAG: hypothetical protein IJ740_10800 [Ruminococcus sp.]|nr:hypothetical protein [Ruminococcus sp.]
MYKKAIRNKLAGAYVSSVMIAVFLLMLVIFAKGAVLYIFGAVLLAFLVLLFGSIFRYKAGIARLVDEYGSELEEDVNNCAVNVCGKYFFFDECLVDLANARMIYYSEIKSISGLTSNGRPAAGELNRYAGAAAELKMTDGSSYLFSDFNSSSAKNSKETLEEYRRFCELLKEYAPHAADANI